MQLPTALRSWSAEKARTLEHAQADTPQPPRSQVWKDLWCPTVLLMEKESESHGVLYWLVQSNLDPLSSLWFFLQEELQSQNCCKLHWRRMGRRPEVSLTAQDACWLLIHFEKNSCDCSPPGSSVHRILQARILEWIAIPFSRGSSPPRDRTWVSHNAGRFFTVWATREAPVSEHGIWNA